MRSAIIVTSLVREEDERQKLANFMIRYARLARLAYVAHPLPRSVNRFSCFRMWENGKLSRDVAFSRSHHGFVSWVVDLLLTFYLVIMLRSRFDIYFGAGSWFQTLPGLLLRKMLLVRKVVFWTTDFQTGRFSIGFLNRMYLAFDRICAEAADYSWVPTPELIGMRIRCGYKIDVARHIVVPYGIEPSSVERVPRNELIPDSVVYMGAFAGLHGFELLLDALPHVVRRRPHVMVTVISYEVFPQHWKQVIAERRLGSSFEVLGYIPHEQTLGDIIKRRRIGLALYGPFFKTFNDPARAKHFLAKGLPVIVSGSLRVNREIEKWGAGIVIEYDGRQLANAILKLLGDESFFEHCRENAIGLCSQYDIEQIFEQALERVKLPVRRDRKI